MIEKTKLDEIEFEEDSKGNTDVFLADEWLVSLEGRGWEENDVRNAVRGYLAGLKKGREDGREQKLAQMKNAVSLIREVLGCPGAPF